MLVGPFGGGRKMTAIRSHARLIDLLASFMIGTWQTNTTSPGKQMYIGHLNTKSGALYCLTFHACWGYQFLTCFLVLRSTAKALQFNCWKSHLENGEFLHLHRQSCRCFLRWRLWPDSIPIWHCDWKKNSVFFSRVSTRLPWKIYLYYTWWICYCHE